ARRPSRHRHPRLRRRRRSRRDPPPARRGDRGHHPRRGPALRGDRLQCSPGGRRMTDDRRRPGGNASRSGATDGPIPAFDLYAIVAAVIAFLVLRPGGLGGGATASGSPRASGSPSSSVSGNVNLGSGSPGARGTSGVKAGCPTSQPPAAPAGEKRVATIQTAKGSFEITLDADLSPIAVGNFEALASCGYYDGVVFHRIATLQDGTPFVIQGGDPKGTGTGGPGYTIQDEPVTAKYIRGTVAMARTSAPNSVGSQFFVVLDDKDQEVLASANTYQIIGSVTKGMETVDAIYQAAGGQENPANPIAMD